MDWAESVMVNHIFSRHKQQNRQKIWEITMGTNTNVIISPLTCHQPFRSASNNDGILVANHDDGNGFAPTETHPMFQPTAGQGTPIFWHLLGPPTAQKQRSHNIGAAPLGPHIDKASTARHDGITLILQLSPTSLHVIVGAASSGCSGKRGCFPRPSQESTMCPPLDIESPIFINQIIAYISKAMVVLNAALQDFKNEQLLHQGGNHRDGTQTVGGKDEMIGDNEGGLVNMAPDSRDKELYSKGGTVNGRAGGPSANQKGKVGTVTKLHDTGLP